MHLDHEMVFKKYQNFRILASSSGFHLWLLRLIQKYVCMDSSVIQTNRDIVFRILSFLKPAYPLAVFLFSAKHPSQLRHFCMENTLPSTSIEQLRPKLAVKAKGSSKNIDAYR